jgi:hypothetical protein
MGSRLDLQAVLEIILGSKNVYFQPPETIKMAYPCIVYQHDYSDTKFADNRPYIYKKRYMITVIDRDPDSSISDQIALLAMCIFDRHFKANNLYHNVYNIYF